MRELLILVLGIIVGVGIGYFGESMVKPYVESYTFASTLALSADVNSTSVGQSAVFRATLTCTIPSELSSLESQIKQFALNNKPITLMIRYGNSTLWSIVSTENAIYGVGESTASFTYTFRDVGQYSFKAVFAGDNILKPSESQELQINVV